jgi:hypothetical protein
MAVDCQLSAPALAVANGQHLTFVLLAALLRHVFARLTHGKGAGGDSSVELTIALLTLRLLHRNLAAVVASSNPLAVTSAGLRQPSTTADVLVKALFALCGTSVSGCVPVWASWGALGRPVSLSVHAGARTPLPPWHMRVFRRRQRPEKTLVRSSVTRPFPLLLLLLPLSCFVPSGRPSPFAPPPRVLSAPGLSAAVSSAAASALCAGVTLLLPAPAKRNTLLMDLLAAAGGDAAAVGRLPLPAPGVAPLLQALCVRFCDPSLLGTLVAPPADAAPWTGSWVSTSGASAAAAGALVLVGDDDGSGTGSVDDSEDDGEDEEEEEPGCTPGTLPLPNEGWL